MILLLVTLTTLCIQVPPKVTLVMASVRVLKHVLPGVVSVPDTLASRQGMGVHLGLAVLPTHTITPLVPIPKLMNGIVAPLFGL